MVIKRVSYDALGACRGMCGIAGLMNYDGSTVDPIRLRAITQTLSHRGPDASNTLCDGPVGLGHTRLSIIDLSDGGAQPRTTDDGEHALTFNGEIYNFHELRAELEKEGAHFTSQSDSEVLLRALTTWGLDAVKRLEGMFAFAWWQRSTQELVLARDRYGIKPLFYSTAQGELCFGSEPKAILRAGAPRGIDPQALHEYLYFGNALGERTIFRDIKQVLPGHAYRFQQNREQRHRYHDPAEVPEIRPGFSRAKAKIRALLNESVKRHLISDVPVGLFLSGGIDSSSLLALATEATASKLSTYSVGFDFDRGVNELPQAKRIAKYFGSNHHEVHIAAASVESVLRELVHCHDQPFGDAADIPLYLLSQKLGGNPKVVLQGDGGDEVFAGYRRYNVLAFSSWWQQASKIPAHKILRRVPSHHAHRLARILEVFASPQQDVLPQLVTTEQRACPPSRVLGPAFRDCAGVDAFQRYHEVISTLGHLDKVQQMLRTDLQILLNGTYLPKVDRATMAHGLEVRVPFLDNALVEYVLGLPSSYKVRRGQKKWLLREAMRGTVPDWVLDGPKKGFGVPFGHWVRGALKPLYHDLVTHPRVLEAGLLDPAALAHMHAEDAAGIRDNGLLMWRLLMLCLWFTEHAK